MDPIAHSLMETPNAISGTGRDQHQLSLSHSSKSIHSEALFSDGDEVYIQHGGAQYLLRRTRDGKLILSK